MPLDPDLRLRLDEIERKIDETSRIADKTRRYFKISLIAGVVTFLIPLIAVLIILPMAMSSFSGLV